MHRQGLTGLLIALLLLAGCGGGGEEGATESSTGASPATSPAPAATSPDSTIAELPEEVAEELKQAKDKAIEERKAQAKSQSAKPPQIEHHDSGGGSAQFKTKGGDNSIVEYGQEASSSERDAAAESLHAYLDSVAARRWAAACFYMSAGLIAGMQQVIERKRPELSSCPEILAALSEQRPQSVLDAGARADVASLRIEGERGMAIYRGVGGDGYVMPMVREEGIWRVSSLAGTPAL